MTQWLSLHAPSAGSLGLTPGQGARSRIPQLKPAAKTWLERKKGRRERGKKEGRKKNSSYRDLQSFVKPLPSRKSAIFQCTFIFQLRLAHLTARSICTPFSLLSDSHTLTRMTTILSNYLGLREMGTLSTALSLETPFIPSGRAEKDIPDLPIGAGCGEGQRQETPKRLPEGSHPLAWA